MIELFEKHKDEYLRFDKIPNEEKMSHLKDLCALNYLAGKLPCREAAIEYCIHDKILLSFTDLHLLTEADVIYIIRCGVRYLKLENCLYMGV